MIFMNFYKSNTLESIVKENLMVKDVCKLMINVSTKVNFIMVKLKMELME